jgi:hypothetical protein
MHVVLKGDELLVEPSLQILERLALFVVNIEGCYDELDCHYVMSLCHISLPINIVNQTSSWGNYGLK